MLPVKSMGCGSCKYILIYINGIGLYISFCCLIFPLNAAFLRSTCVAVCKSHSMLLTATEVSREKPVPLTVDTQAAPWHL